MRLFKRPTEPDWDAIDAENEAGMALLSAGMATDDLKELHELWQRANKLIGSERAPADHAAFLAYGYLEGKRDALRARA